MVAGADRQIDPAQHMDARRAGAERDMNVVEQDGGCAQGGLPYMTGAAEGGDRPIAYGFFSMSVKEKLTVHLVALVAALALLLAPAAPQERELQIVVLGDSLTAGYGLAAEHSVPSRLQSRLDAEGYDYEVVNAGVSGDTSAGGLSRLDWVLEGDVAILVIELGANDGLRGLPVQNLRRNLDAIITRARARGITVLLTGMEAPPNYGAAYTAEFRQVFHDLAQSHDVAFLPFFLEGVAGVPHLNLRDGIHPNADGTRAIEDVVWNVLEPLLDRQAE
jgi:acyl-CoA thioesterase I